ncbi:MAG: DUF167 domain-containing protein [Candidatus Doudnabacteria bacterium]|nr:DUF167 domain-containing protein [Candidatus Doudnabacteria bacterium]
MKITVEVRANAKETKVEQTAKGLKVYVRQQPLEGRANDAVTKALAEFFKTKAYNIILLRGVKSKQKVFEIRYVKE